MRLTQVFSGVDGCFAGSDAAPGSSPGAGRDIASRSFGTGGETDDSFSTGRALASRSLGVGGALVSCSFIGAGATGGASLMTGFSSTVEICVALDPTGGSTGSRAGVSRAVDAAGC